MASLSKKSRNDPMVDVVSAIKKLSTSHRVTTNDEMRGFFTRYCNYHNRLRG